MKLLVLTLQSVDLADEGRYIDLFWLSPLLSTLSKWLPDHRVLQTISSIVGRDFLFAPPLIYGDNLFCGELSVLVEA